MTGSPESHELARGHNRSVFARRGWIRPALLPLASLLLLSVRSADAHVGAGVEPGFAVVYELSPNQLQLNILIPEELLGRLLGPQAEIDASMNERSALALAQAFVDLVRRQQPLALNGQTVDPELAHGTFMAPKDAGTEDRPSDSTASSSVGVSKIEIRSSPWRLAQLRLVYPSPRGIDRLRIRWGLDEAYVEHAGDPDLERRLPTIEATLLAEGDRIRMIFRPSEPEYTWSARRSATDAPQTPPTAKPAWSDLAWYLGLVLGLSILGGLAVRAPLKLRLILLAGGLGLLAVFLRLGPVSTPLSSPEWTSEEEALAGLRAVHARTYRAFHHSREDAILAELAKAVDPNLLDHVYDQIRATLVLRDHTGVTSTVESTEIVRAELVRMDRATHRVELLATWKVLSRAEHWGHLHDRLKEVEARVTLQASNEGDGAPGWQMVGLEILDHRRLRPSSTSSVSAEPVQE